MRRWLPIAILALTVAACATTDQRPEGIVERWIVSMNQGPAGEPWRWADDYATSEVSPTWDTDEPGAIDSFSLGAARAEGDAYVVAFTLERLDGRVVSGDAVVAWRSLPDETTEPVVIEVRLGEPTGPTGRWEEGSPTVAWAIALALALVLASISVLGVRLVERRSR